MKLREFITAPDTRQNLRQYIQTSMQEWITEGGDLNELAQQLYSTIGHSLDLEGENFEVTAEDIQQAIDEWKASRKLCTSGKPDSALGASALSSCKAQGYRSRDGDMSHKIGKHRVKVAGKKIKGKKYGGPLPDWS